MARAGHRRTARVACVAGSAVVALLLGGLPGPASATPGVSCPDGRTPTLAQPMNSTRALAGLGERLARVAHNGDQTTQALRDTLANDSSLWVDQCGEPFYVEAAGSPGVDPGTDVPAADLPSTAEAFTLHSRPTSTHTLYLDFDGQAISGTGWNTAYSLPDWTAPAFSTDSDPTTFSEAERRIILEVWARVADDYAPFDVDVTTADPGPEGLARSSNSDVRFGTRALITPDETMAAVCSCGGIAYLGVFDKTWGASYQPAFVLAQNLSNSAKNIAEAASHEVGHNFGLNHDGTTAGAEYYSGGGGWAPIMGVGYYQKVTQWSRGEYPKANRTEDDTAIISAGGAPVIADDVGNSAATATTVTPGTLVSGLIGTQADTDWFAFTATGTVTVTATPTAAAPDLDLRLSLTTADGTVLATSGPPYAAADWPATSAATLTFALPRTASYRVMVDGDGNGVAGSDGATDYGSLGSYQLTVGFGGPTAIMPTPGTLTAGVATSLALQAAGGLPPYSWSLSGGSLPPGLTLSGDHILGTPTAAGSATAILTVTDSRPSTDSRSLALEVAPAVTLDPVADRELTVGAPATVALSPHGGVAPYAWALAGSPVPGMTFAEGTLSGTPTTAGSATLTVTATDRNGGSATRTFTVSVAALPAPDPVAQGEPPQAAGQAAAANQPVADPGTATLVVAGPVAPLSVPRSVTLPTARRNRPYTAWLPSSGGQAPLTWTLAKGKLAKGLTLSPTGLVSGTPRKKGKATLTVSVRDARGALGRVRVTLRVR